MFVSIKNYKGKAGSQPSWHNDKSYAWQSKVKTACGLEYSRIDLFSKKKLSNTDKRCSNCKDAVEQNRRHWASSGVSNAST